MHQLGLLDDHYSLLEEGQPSSPLSVLVAVGGHVPARTDASTYAPLRGQRDAPLTVHRS